VVIGSAPWALVNAVFPSRGIPYRENDRALITVLEDAALILSAGAALVVSGALVLAGLYELVHGRNVPGVLGRGYFPRHGPRRADSWRPGRWRRNGCLVLGLGFNFFFLALWLVALTFR
jgi:hypothetical protein